MPFIIQWVESCSGAEDVVKLQTPAGQLILYSQQGVISKTDWGLGDCPNQSGEHELNQYWQNADKRINVKLLKQGSVYRNQVWAALCQIPFGETMTYSALAKKIGSSARAVGNACRDNPYALIIPCHRVVSVSGMGGYCGQTEGDLMAIKHKLLEFEASHKK
ncbi:MAG: MGMT family protein [Methylobacter sp.]|uniref:methylated-DNA--[protein]-cysteine S-methyltransferase n=1 Tax=Methylobacter sp. TaxID=2051955 RepID=UPI00273099FD|nr:MGMT family protein [Methylobacter sp.]MDP1665071.1 MGMT family protein [Methylobacter sp.]MDP1971143.1 MGMT family protein [Methylobacter sp.]